MYYIQLDNLANQSFTLPVNGRVLKISLRTFRGRVYFSLANEVEEYVIASVKCFDKVWLLGPRDEDSYGGNFRFEDDDGKDPSYENFNRSCVLTFYPSDGIE